MHIGTHTVISMTYIVDWLVTCCIAVILMCYATGGGGGGEVN